MANTRSSQKKQTQLAFSPLPSSSPARMSQLEAVRERAAAITVSLSPSPRKKRKIVQISLPTPANSSQPEEFLNLTQITPVSRNTRSFMNQGGTRALSNEKTLKPSCKTFPWSELGVFGDSESTASDATTDRAQTMLKNKPCAVISDDEESTDSDVHVTSHSKRARAVEISSNQAKEASSNSAASTDGESDDPPIIPRRRSAKAEISTPLVHTKRQEQDLAQDLEFLGPVDAESPRLLRRAAESPKKTPREKALEALKHSRSKHQGVQNKDRDGHPGTSVKANMTQSNHEGTRSSNDESDIPIDDDEASFNSGVEDFVVDDENDMLGAPVELPLEFSRYKSMKLKELFRYAIEWMVQKKINPAFAMNDKIFRLAFERLDDFVTGMAGSKFQSSAWTSKFNKQLMARPILEAHHFKNSGILHDRCDACNRSGHPATWEVCFTGKRYDRNSLEESSDDDDTESGDDAPIANSKFFIGKFCMQNARTAHTLRHWKFHLNEWVVDYLKEEGYCTPEKIVERDSWNIKQRREYANSVVDEMDRAGEIKKLHRDFRNEINNAQNMRIDSNVDKADSTILPIEMIWIGDGRGIFSLDDFGFALSDDEITDIDWEDSEASNSSSAVLA